MRRSTIWSNTFCRCELLLYSKLSIQYAGKPIVIVLDIERLWKFVKKKCLYNAYYETFDDFKKGINDCLNRVENEYKHELETLMTPKFQNLKKIQLLAL